MNDQILDNGLQLNSENEVNHKVQWAGFWVRVLGSIIDGLACLPLIAINMYNLYVLKNLSLQLSITFILMLYKPLMEFKYGATLGKMAVGIKVVNSNYNRISLLQSVIRFTPWLVGEVISIITMILLFQNEEFLSTTNITGVSRLQNEVVPSIYSIMGSLLLLGSVIVVAFNDKKQGVHDMLAGTYCIYK